EPSECRNLAMNTESLHKRLTPMEHAALFDAAKVRALELRHEAIRDCWSAVAGGVGCAWLPDRASAGRTEPPNIVIPCRGMARLDNVRGITLHVVHGSVWITQSDSCADVSLGVGESFCVTRSGRTLVAAC